MSCSPELLEWLEECYNEDKKHNNVKIDCVIYNNIHNTGTGVVYNDKALGDTIYYDGQKSGKKDHLIKAKTTLYLEKDTGDEWIYRGLITDVNIISRVHINKFKLKVDRSHIHNGISDGTRLYHVKGINKGRGSCWTKKSSLSRLGFFFHDINAMEGIIPVRYQNSM